MSGSESDPAGEGPQSDESAESPAQLAGRPAQVDLLRSIGKLGIMYRQVLLLFLLSFYVYVLLLYFAWYWTTTARCHDDIPGLLYSLWEPAPNLC